MYSAVHVVKKLLEVSCIEHWLQIPPYVHDDALADEMADSDRGDSNSFENISIILPFVIEKRFNLLLDLQNVVQKGYINSMNQCSIQLLQIINDILDFAKLTSHKMELNPECFSIEEIKDIIMDAMEHRLNLV